MISIRHFFWTLLLFAVFMQTDSVRPAEPPQFVLDGTFREGNGVYAPGESIILDVILRPTAPNNHVSDSVELLAGLVQLTASSTMPISGIHTKIIPNTPQPISFVTPDTEGVYEITLEVTQRVAQQRPFPNVPRLAEPVYTVRTVAEVRRQFVILSAETAPRNAGSWTLSDTRDLLAKDTDPPSRRHLLPRVSDLPRIGDLPRPAELLNVSPFTRLNPRTLNVREQSHPASGIADLDDGAVYFWSPDESVVRFPLEESHTHPGFMTFVEGTSSAHIPLEVEVGQPYLIEIDYPAYVPQQFELAVADPMPNKTAEVHGQSMRLWRLNTAATIHIAEHIVQDRPTSPLGTHQLLFWASTESPELRIRNHQPAGEILFRNLRISRVTVSGQSENQRLPKLFEEKAQRKRIGQILIPFNLAGTPTHPEHRPNWQATYEQCSRLLDELSRGGYDGVMLTVGAFSEHLDLFFRRFNSEGLTLIPAIEFNFPIHSLEQLLQQHPGITEEILIANPHHRRQYNVLHPAVQQAMSEIVFGLAERFGHHPSYGGIAVVLTPESYAQLPFAVYSPDDYTFAQFRRETESQLDIPFPDEQRLRHTMPTQQYLEQKNIERIQFLQGNPQVWDAWVRWRAAKVSLFYSNLARHVSAKRNDVPLYLLGGTMLDQAEIQDYCVPTMPRNFATLQAIQLLGFDLPRIAKEESLHFLKPVRIKTKNNWSYESLNSADSVALFSTSSGLPGVQFVHKDGNTTAGSRYVPAHIQSRQRFVRQLAQADTMMFIDAGSALTMGQETEMFDLLDTFRRLPPIPFRTFQQNDTSLQPLTVRYRSMPDGMIMYIVNDAPFAVDADFFFTADLSSRMTELTGHRMIRTYNRRTQFGTHSWRASLAPYDLMAVQISDTNAKIESVSVVRHAAMYGGEGKLKKKAEELNHRVHAARTGVRWDGLKNADFELPLDAADGIIGWQCFGQSFNATLDQTAVQNGQNSVRLTNTLEEPGTFLSQPLNITATGRLGISMFVGITEECQSLPMNVVLTATHRGQPFLRSVAVEEMFLKTLENVTPKNGVRWQQIIVPFGRLPMNSLEEVRIGVQYSGVGTFWLDDIKLYQVLFSASEMIELQKMSVVANERYSSERVSDLIVQLEGYWPQFLFKHVPATELMPNASPPEKSVTTEKTTPSKPNSLYQRVRGMFGM